MSPIAKANFDRAKEMFPSITEMGEDEWLAFFDTREGFHAIGRILGDIYQEIEAQSAKARGHVRMGRRPGLTQVPLEKVFEAIFPEKYSQESFVDSFRQVMVGRTQREMAALMHTSQAQVSRLLNGEVKPDMADLELIAGALGISPSYFLEWRTFFLAEVLTHAYTARPNMSITAFQRLKGTRRGVI